MAKEKDTTTPMMKQYYGFKAQYPEALLLFRCGDFYEAYGEDAVKASKVLGIVLTRRSSATADAIPMAGVPFHAIDVYLPKLIRAGYKVAICDQLEDPKFAKSIVKRGVTEVITPGVAYGEQMLEQKENNFLAGLTFGRIVRGQLVQQPVRIGSSWTEASNTAGPDKNAEESTLVCGAAFLDVSTGAFKVAQGPVEYIATLFASMRPKEVVVPRGSERYVRGRFGDGAYISSLEEWAFVQDAASEKLKKQLGVRSLKGFAIDTQPLGICSAGALLFYLEQTQHTGLGNICSISRIDGAKFVWMDRFTFRNLEVFSSASGTDGTALVDIIDQCSSPMGARLLRSWLAMPVMDIAELNARYDVVQYFVEHEEALAELQGHLSDVGDLERIISRAAAGKIMPREVMQLGRSLAQMGPIGRLCQGRGIAELDRMMSLMRECTPLLDSIRHTMAEDPAANASKGDIIAPGVNAELDELRSISRGGKEYLLAMQQRETERTGISSLKISYNNVFGYYIEVRNTFRDKVPPEWIRKQTLVNAERYITEELKEYEEKILTAETKIYEIETQIFAGLVTEIQHAIRDIQEDCQIIARLDVLAGFAQLARDSRYCRPEMNRSRTLDIRAGRHPVIEKLMPAGEEYVPNDIYLDTVQQQIIILTGPNMAGKSALLRQTALIVLMAQIGSWVPAKSASIGYFDKIFTRVGATDNISRGESTFMVEMLETSMIMHNLSDRSLVLLDEIGRGTSTYDGMSIARALVEYIHEYGHGAKTLFATHYHELNDLECIYPRVKNFHVAVKEVGKDIIFLRKLREGGVAHSFGIHVARLAGMPREVLESAERTLSGLEGGSFRPAFQSVTQGANDDNETDNTSAAAVLAEGASSADAGVQLSFFQLDDPTLGALRDYLAGADLDNMTPLQAFDLLRKMKQELGL